MRGLLERLLGLHADDLPKCGIFFLYLLLCETVFTALIPVRDTLFLKEFGVASLPWMFVCYGIVSTVFATVHARLADRLPRLRLIIGTCLLISLSYVGFWHAVRSGWRWSYPIFYVWAEVSGTMLFTQFWLLASDCHTARDAKRVFGVIGSGTVLGFILGGIAVRECVRLIGTANLLLAIAILVLVCACLAAATWRAFGTGAGPGQPPAGRGRVQAPPRTDAAPGLAVLLGAPYQRLVAAVMLSMGLVCTFVDFQWKSIASATYSSDELARYFGTMNAAIGSVACIVQLFFTGRILSRFGVVAGLTLTPAFMLAASGWLAASPGIAAVSLLKFSDVAFHCSVNDASVQLLYLHFPAALKGRIRALMDGAIGPLAFAVAGGVLIWLGPGFAADQLGMLTIPLLLCWLFLVRLLGREYLATLRKTLSEKRLRRVHEGEQLDERLTMKSLLDLCYSPDESTSLFALKWARAASPGRASQHAARLLESPHASVQTAALELLEEVPVPAALPGVEAAVSHGKSPEIRAAAAGAVAAATGERAIGRLMRLIEKEPSMREPSLTAILRHGGLPGMLAAGPELETLLQSPDPVKRASAARIVGEAAQPALHRQLVPLLSDADGSVRREAARAGASCRDAASIVPLAALLTDPAAGAEAEKSLAVFGDEAISTIDAALSRQDCSPALWRAAVRVLRTIGTPRAFDALLVRAFAAGERERGFALRAAARIARESTAPLAAVGVSSAVEREARVAYQIAANKAAFLLAYPGRLLAELAGREWERAIDRLWSLIALAEEPALTGRIRKNLRFGTATQRANAVELLESFLPRQLRKPVLALLEGRPDNEVIAAGANIYSVAPLNPLDWLDERLGSRDEWCRAVVLDSAGHHGLRQFGDRARAAIADDSPAVREAALQALTLLAPEAALDARVRLESDSDPRVRRFAVALGLGGRGADGLPAMTRLDLARNMQRVPLFETAPLEDLGGLASIAHLAGVEAGVEVVRQSESGDRLYLVLEGRLDVRVDGTVVGELGPHASFGEMAILEQEPRSATVRALDRCSLLELASADFQRFLEQTPEVGANLVKGLVLRLRSLNLRLASGNVPAPAEIIE